MFVDTIQSLSDELAERGYHILLCVSGYTPQTEAELVATLLSRRPDGVVLTGIHHTAELKKVILNAAIPVVEIWDLTQRPSICWSVFRMKKLVRRWQTIC
jgi:LacI family gluconate utilization system Gnt-I transcriptional repressor